MTQKETEYYLYCGIKLGWHDKTFADYTNDEKALKMVRNYIRKSDEFVNDGLGMYLWGSNGTGKCLAKGTKVIKADLTIIPVEDVKVGDRLLRPDGKFNTVLSITHGIDNLYKIHQKRFNDYVVNSQHILSLKFMANDDVYAYKKGDILNIPIKNFLNKSPKFQKLFGGWKPNLMKFEEQEVLIDPYFLGTWLGDGDSNAIVLTSMDATIIRYWRNFAIKNGWELHKFSDNDTKSKAHRYNIYTRTSGGVNPLKELFKNYNLINNKHIPIEYIYNSSDVRLRLLAGILDTDGYRNSSTCSYEIAQKRENLIDEIILLCRTLGINCRKITKVINGVTYYKTHISIEDVPVPCRLQRKIPSARKRQTETRVSGITIESIGKGEYYGFSLDGDNLFLLEDFTVTHNSHLLNCAFKRFIEKGYTVRLFSMDELVDKYTSSWYSDEQKQDLTKILRDVQFLGIDEFGKNVDSSGEPLPIPDFVKRVIESVVRYRVQMKRPLWITSNTEPKYVKKVFSEDVASLLSEAVVTVCVTGGDFRKTIASRNKRKLM